MSRFLPAVSLAAVLWLVTVTSSAAVVTNMTVPLNQTVFNPCTSDLIAFTGNIHIVVAMTPDASGGFHFHADVNVSGVTGVGAPSGITYHRVRGDWVEFYAPTPFSVATTFNYTFCLVNTATLPHL